MIDPPERTRTRPGLKLDRESADDSVLLSTRFSRLLAFLAFVLVAAASPVAAQSLAPDHLGDQRSLYGYPYWDLTQYSSHLEDSSRNQSIGDMMQVSPGSWTSMTSHSGVIGFSNSAHWLTGVLDLDPHATNEWVIFVPRSTTDHLDLYLVADGEIIHHKPGGFSLPAISRAMDVLGTPFPIPEHLSGRIQFFLRAQDAAQLLVLEPRLVERHVLVRQDRDIRMLLAVIISAIVVLSIYNLVIFSTTRETSYLVYGLFMLCSASMLFCLCGLAALYIWEDSALWKRPTTLALSSLTAALNLSFCVSILPMKQLAPRLRKVALALIALGLFNTILASLGEEVYSVRITAGIGLALSPLTVSAGLMAWRKGLIQGKYYFLSALLLTTAVFYHISSGLGLLPRFAPFPAELPMAASSAVEALLFSMALAARISQLRQQTLDLNEALRTSHGDLEQKVEERTKELIEAQAQLVHAARSAGMAEVAANTLHNVGNVLNAVTISAGVLRVGLERFQPSKVTRVADALEKNLGEGGLHALSDERVYKLADYTRRFADQAALEKNEHLEEVAQLVARIDEIRRIVSVQQSFASVSGLKEITRLDELVDASLDVMWPGRDPRPSWLSTQCDQLDPVFTDRSKALQIIVNLVGNAVAALQDVPAEERSLRIELAEGDGAYQEVRVVDNGEGIDPAVMESIFRHGFTTRRDGHGFGLHSGALSARELGGSLEAQSEGRGCGATFVLSLPVTDEGTARAK